MLQIRISSKTKYFKNICKSQPQLNYSQKKINLILEHDFHDMYRLRVGVVCPTWTNIKVCRKWAPSLIRIRVSVPLPFPFSDSIISFLKDSLFSSICFFLLSQKE